MREEELKVLKRQNTLFSRSVFVVWLTPMLITSAIFALFIFTGNEMNAKSAFTLISTLMILQVFCLTPTLKPNVFKPSIRMLPLAIAVLLESKVALDRVTKFLLADEVQLESRKTENVESEEAIKVRNGNFYWLTEKEKLLKKEKEEEKKKMKVPIVSKAEPLDVSSEKQENIKISPNLNHESPEKKKVGNESEYKLILKDINLSIKKESFVAILGE